MNLRINRAKFAPGESLDKGILKKARFKRKGILSKIFKKRKTTYFAKDCYVECFDSQLIMLSMLGKFNRCFTSSELYYHDNILTKIIIYCLSFRIPGFDIPTTAETFFDDFYSICSQHYGESNGQFGDWGYIWEDSEKILKIGLFNNNQNFVIIWDKKLTPEGN